MSVVVHKSQSTLIIQTISGRLRRQGCTIECRLQHRQMLIARQVVVGDPILLVRHTYITSFHFHNNSAW